MPRRPAAPGSRTAEARFQRLLLEHAQEAQAIVRAPLGLDATNLPLAFDLVSIQRRLEEWAVGLVEGPAAAALATEAAKAGLRYAQNLSAVLSADPRTWGASEEEEVRRAVVAIEKRYADQIAKQAKWLSDDLISTLAEAQAGGADADSISRTLGQRFGVAETYAKRTAEQTVRASVEQASRARQRGAGVVEIIWRIVDFNARPLHQQLDGTRLALDGPGHPTEGFPGDPFGCRCWGEPVLSEGMAVPIRPRDPRAGMTRRGLPPPQTPTPPSTSLEGLLQTMVEFP